MDTFEQLERWLDVADTMEKQFKALKEELWARIEANMDASDKNRVLIRNGMVVERVYQTRIAVADSEQAAKILPSEVHWNEDGSYAVEGPYYLVTKTIRVLDADLLDVAVKNRWVSREQLDQLVQIKTTKMRLHKKATKAERDALDNLEG